jgi:GT2 family glycosyltransferase
MTGATGIVAIGRNEGDRFIACLKALPAKLPVVYVDSGSGDGSVAVAKDHGAHVIELPPFPAFTAARARNAGLAELIKLYPQVDLVQFLDGDCAIVDNWIDSAATVLRAQPNLAAVFGRRRERFPEASLYNSQCDREWDVPIGEARACGGDVLMRVAAFQDVGGFCDSIVAGEEPDLCLRMRAKGWRIERLDAEMTLHDANILTFGAWWKRAKRAGHAYAEHVWRHGGNSDPDWVRQLLSTCLWALVLPGTAIVMLTAWPLLGWFAPALFGLILSAYPLQYLRMGRRELKFGSTSIYAWGSAGLILLAKFAQLAGMVRFVRNLLFRRAPSLIEYKPG